MIFHHNLDVNEFLFSNRGVIHRRKIGAIFLRRKFSTGILTT